MRKERTKIGCWRTKPELQKQKRGWQEGGYTVSIHMKCLRRPSFLLDPELVAK